MEEAASRKMLPPCWPFVLSSYGSVRCVTDALDGTASLLGQVRVLTAETKFCGQLSCPLFVRKPCDTWVSAMQPPVSVVLR